MENNDYTDFLEYIKNEFGKFLRLSDKGMYVRFHASQARSKSMYIRKLLKQFRVMSIANDKKLKDSKIDGRRKL